MTCKNPESYCASDRWNKLLNEFDLDGRQNFEMHFVKRVLDSPVSITTAVCSTLKLFILLE